MGLIDKLRRRLKTVRASASITVPEFYSPIPEIDELKQLDPGWWQTPSELPGIEMNEKLQVQYLEIFRQFKNEYNLFPAAPTDSPHEFHFNNSSFDGTDALVLYCMIRHLKPRKIIEVGGGFSTFLSAKACLQNGNTELVCVEPFPNPVLKAGFPGLTRIIEKKAQTLPLDFFVHLDERDILFIDSTHTVKTGGDVNYLFLEVIPRLRKGVYIHCHDIFLPAEYPRSWVLDLHLYWTEMYLLRAFLAFNDAFEVVFANSFLAIDHLEEMRSVFPNSPWHGGGSFWMRRIK